MERYRLAEKCDYGGLKDEMIRDTALSHQLQLDPNLRVIKQNQSPTETSSRRTTNRAQRSIRRSDKPSSFSSTLRASDSKRFKIKRPQAHSYSQKDRDVKTAKKMCTRCGNESHPHDKCPAKDATCHRCNKNYSSQCFSKGLSEITTESTSAWFTTVILN